MYPCGEVVVLLKLGASGGRDDVLSETLLLVSEALLLNRLVVLATVSASIIRCRFRILSQGQIKLPTKGGCTGRRTNSDMLRARERMQREVAHKQAYKTSPPCRIH